VTIRGDTGRILADIIIGKPVAGHGDFRFVRQPGQKRVYASRVGSLRISTAFGDWIERDVLQVERDEIDTINIVNYSVDERTGHVIPDEAVLLHEKGKDEWTLQGVAAADTLDARRVELLLTNLMGLRIVGVLPKPAGITAMLSRVTGETRINPDDRVDLARKGFRLAPDGRLLSSKGEIVLHTRRGIFYTLRFGEIAPGVTMPSTDSAEEESTEQVAHENRYLFIMVNFDSDTAATPGQAKEGEAKAALLRARFAPWYYVISANSVSGIRVHRKDLVKPKQAPSRHHDHYD
jgi:hypothetical protein